MKLISNNKPEYFRDRIFNDKKAKFTKRKEAQAQLDDNINTVIKDLTVILQNSPVKGMSTRRELCNYIKILKKQLAMSCQKNIAN